MHTRLPRRSLLVVLCLALLVLVAVPVIGQSPDAGLGQRIRARVDKAGSYRFEADVSEVLVPRPLPELIGQRQQNVEMRMEGRVAAPDHMHMEIMVANDVVEVPSMSIVQQDGQVYVETSAGELVLADSPLSQSLTGSYVEYLAAAENVEAMASSDDAPGQEHYCFVVSGQRLADAVNERMMEALRRQGSLPDGVQLESSFALLNTQGSGELWLNADGLPERMVLDLEQSGISREYDARMHVVVRYSDYGRLSEIAGAVQDDDGAWRIETLPLVQKASHQALIETVRPYATFSWVLLIGVLGFALVARRRPRFAYAVVVLFTIISMVGGTPVRAAQVARFMARHASTGTASQRGPARLPSVDDEIKPTPKAGPELSAPQLGLPQLPSANAPASAPSSSGATLRESSSGSDPDLACGSGEAGKDTDGDGLLDRTENCLGTNIYEEDTDFDGVSDKVETDGLEWPSGSGKMWYGNPTNPDSNGDGQFDGLEWADPDGKAPNHDIDGDGVPNLWDDDDDDDGVTDLHDISPYAYTPVTDTISFSTEGAGFDGYQYIEIQIVPENPEHIRLTLSSLDWPYDNQGQIRDVDHSKEDVTLIPMLEIATNTLPDRDRAFEAGVTVQDKEEGDDLIYATLAPVGEGGRVEAFSAKVPYEPEKLADIRWNSVRLKWVAQAQVDSWKAVKYRGTTGWQVVAEPTPIHTYDEAYFVSGLQIIKGRDFTTALLGTPDSPNDDRTLFQVLLGVSATFMSYMTPDLDEIMGRFNNADPNADVLYTWGVHPSDVEEAMPQTTHDRDMGLSDSSDRAADFLADHHYPHSSNPSLIALLQEEVGIWELSEEGTGEVATGFHVDLGNVPMVTQRSAKLNTYEYVDDAWLSFDAGEQFETIDERYPEADLQGVVDRLKDEYPDLTTDDLLSVLLMFYGSWSVGMNRLVAIDGDDQLPDEPETLDNDVHDDLNREDEDHLAAYLLDVAELAKPGGGLRVGDTQAQAYAYQQAQGPKAATLNVPIEKCRDFCQTIRVMPTLPGLNGLKDQVLGGIKLIAGCRTFYKALFMANIPFKGMFTLSQAKLGMIAGIISLSYLWLTFLIGFATGDYENPFAWRAALAYAIATTIWSVVMFVVALNPIGLAISLCVAIIDLLVIACTLGQFSIIGEAIKFFSKMFYDVRVLTEFDDMDYRNTSSGLENPAMGFVPGSKMIISQDYHAKIKGTKHADNDDIEDSYAYGYFSAEATQASASSERGRIDANRSGNTLYTENWMEAYYVFDEPALNVELDALSKAKIKTFYEECGLWGAACSRKSTRFTMPTDMREDRQWDPVTVRVDVVPGTLDELWAWDVLTNRDPDCDGLDTAKEDEIGTQSDNWDTDGDGLSDGFEHEQRDDLGTDPLVADTDGDGLNDGLEYRLSLDIGDADTDDDGLTDGQEVFHYDGTNWVGGWQLENIPDGEHTYWAFSDPLQADQDGDGLEDKSEKAYATSPTGYNDAPHLELVGEELYDGDNGDAAVYLEPGDTVTLTINLDSVGPDPVDAVVTLCAPDFLENLTVVSIEGDHEPLATAASGCNGLEWAFTGGDTLQFLESVEIVVTATARNVASAEGEATVSFPYTMGDTEENIESREPIVLDNEAPTVAFTVPEDGERIGNGTSDYVIGGDSADETTWVESVELNVPGEGIVTAEGTEVWAHTWHIPADGQYTLTATAIDLLGHRSVADTVDVTVDNTAPDVTFDLPDRSYVRGEGEGDIEITLTGTATDNGAAPTGLTRVQVSLDGQPWRDVWTSDSYPTTTNWTAAWTLPGGTTAQGEHVALVRALDRAMNVCDPLERVVIVDVLAPTTSLGSNEYRVDPPHVQTGQQTTLYGVSNEAGSAPEPSRPEELLGALDGLLDATIWLGLTSVTDNDEGISLTWVGDMNADRLADLAIGLPAAEGDAGRVTVVYGRAGDWPAPTAMEAIADSDTSFVGQAGAGIGAELAAAGDVNGDGTAELLVGDPQNDRTFLIFGDTMPLGSDEELDGPNDEVWTVLRAGTLSIAHTEMGDNQAAAGDVNGDGYDDLLIGAGDKVYLLLGETGTWPNEVDVEHQAAAAITADPETVSMTGVGDVDGDAYDDFAIASGKTIYLFLGHDGYAHNPPTTPESLSLDDADDTFDSETSNAQIVRLGDMNDDGLDDFGFRSGQTPVVVYGDADGDWTAFAVEGHDPPASGWLAGPGDVDGDGRCDLIVGNSAGDAYLILGDDPETIHATWTDVEAAATAPYVAGADLNSDGSSDVLLLPAEDDAYAARLGGAPFGHVNIASPEALPRRATSAPSRAMMAGERLMVTTRYVNDDAGCDGSSPCYPSIQAAIDDADPGDTILVQPGAYESFCVDGVDNLTLRGVMADAVFVDGAGGPYACKIEDATGVTIESMTLRSAQAAVLLNDAGLGGAQDPAKRIALNTLLIYDAGHAVSMSRSSTAALSRCTLAGGTDHIEVTGDAPTVADPDWSANLATGSTPTSDGGGGIVGHDEKVFFSVGTDSDTFRQYSPSGGAWSTKASLPLDRDVSATNPTSDGSQYLYQLPGSRWEAMGSGLSSGAVVNDIAARDGVVYVVGQFGSAGGVSVKNIARWDGSAWSAVSGGVMKSGGGEVLHSVAVDSSGNVYVAGDFDQAGGAPANYVAKWNSGSGWSAMGNLGTVPAAVGVADDGTVYVGSNDALSGGTSGFWYWSGSAWVSLSSSLDVYDIQPDVREADTIALVGDFGTDDLKRYDGGDDSWDNTNFGISGTVYSFGIFGGPDEPTRGGWEGAEYVLGGDFDIENSGVTGSNVAHMLYDCPGGGCSWNCKDMDGGTNGVVRAVAVDKGNTYFVGDFTEVGGKAIPYIARWDGREWHALEGASDHANGTISAVAFDNGHLYAGGAFSTIEGTTANRIADWSQPLCRYDVVGNAWTELAPIPQALGEGAALTSDRDGYLYALPAGYSRRFYRYDVSTDTWVQRGSLEKDGAAAQGASLAYAHGAVYALSGNDTARAYRYATSGNSWSRLDDLPTGVASYGAAWVCDGMDTIYAIQGAKKFSAYDVPGDTWEVLGDGSGGTTDDADLPADVAAGGDLAWVAGDQELYAVRGSNTNAFWRYDAIDRETHLALDHNLFSVAETATQGPWYNLSLADMPEDFRVEGADNVWVGGASTAWSPDVTVWPESRLDLGEQVTHDEAAMLDPDRHLYCLTMDSTVDAGYHSPVADVVVPDDYASIQDAINSGTNRVLVKPGQYDQSFYLVSGVEVVGTRADQVVLAPPPGHSGPIVTAEGVTGATVKNLTITGDDSLVGVRAEGGVEHTRLERCIVRDTATAVEVHGGDADFELVSNTIVENAQGVVCQSCAPLDLRNTILAYHTGTALTTAQGPDDLHAHWMLDEDAGATSFADAANGHTATCSGGGCPEAGQPGVHDKALVFDGVDDVIQATTANPSSLQQFTLAAWVYHDLLPDGEIQRYITLANEKAVLRYDGINGSDQLHLYATSGGQIHSVRVDGLLETRRWRHVAGTYDGHMLRLYYDGEQVGCAAVEGALGGGTGAKLSHPTETLDGALDDVRIYDRALSAGEVYGLYRGCDANMLNRYNLYWANGTDQAPNDPGAAEVFLDPRFVDLPNHNYYTGDYSPVIDAGNPTDPHPPNTGERVDIGYIEQGRAAYYVDDDYCELCPNDGLTWEVDAFDTIAEALDVAADEQVRVGQALAGSIACGVYHTDEVPRPLSDSEESEVVSSIDVPLRGYVTDIELFGLEIDHDRVSDLEVLIESPSGWMGNLLELSACDDAGVDLSLNDTAASAAPCPPTGGGTYRPAQWLSRFDGDHAEGTWALHVRDTVGDDVGGTLEGWGIEICARELPPILTVGVGPGTYTETLSLPSYVRLAGLSADDVTLASDAGATPVTFDGVVHAEVSGCTIRGSASDDGVLLTGGSNNITVARNLIRGHQRGIHVSEGASGEALFNTIVGRSKAGGHDGVYAEDAGSQITAQCNIVDAFDHGLRSDGDGNIYSNYNHLASNDTDHGSVVFTGDHDLTSDDAKFEGSGSYHLLPSAPALDAAAPWEPVPPGGGVVADIGYHELQALPAVVFLGAEGESTALANSGIKTVEASVVPVGDPQDTVADTAPAAWSTVYDDASSSQAKVTWQTSVSPVGAGLHRIYGRAEDRVGNVEDDPSVWHIGDLIADDQSPVVTMVSPSGSVQTEVELRAQVVDYVQGQFTVETVQFEIDGSPIDAGWAIEPWEPADGVPRVFRTWATLTQGTTPSVVAVAYDRSGRRGHSSSVLLSVDSAATSDSTPPSLLVSHPSGGGAEQIPVVFDGTVNDGGSGVDSVEVSLDGGITWTPAAVSGSDWSLSWDPPWRQDDVSYPSMVRAHDKAGNTVTETLTLRVDNVPPTPNGIRFQKAYAFYDWEDTEPGDHMDYVSDFRVCFPPLWAWDGSDANGDSLRYQMAIDMLPNTQPNLGGTWAPRPVSCVEQQISVPGEWYVHVFYRDAAGNITMRHYGPWYLGTFGEALIHCNDRRQSIELDGLVDLDHNEWGDHEFLDDDERGTQQGRDVQQLWAAWDGAGFYAAWQGAQWDSDGAVWFYLDVNSNDDIGIDRTVWYPYKSLPFKADYAIRVNGRQSAQKWIRSSGYWTDGGAAEYAHGDLGGTEIRFPWELPLYNVQDVRLLAYAEDDDGDVWSVFPTGNALDETWHEYYYWNTLCSILHGVNQNQPRYTDLSLDLYSELAGDDEVGPGSTISLTIKIGNNEIREALGATLQIATGGAMGLIDLAGVPCPGCADALDVWTIPLPAIPPDTEIEITLSSVLHDDLSLFDLVSITGTLSVLDHVVGADGFSFPVDFLAPVVSIDANYGDVIGVGEQVVTGTAFDRSILLTPGGGGSGGPAPLPGDFTGGGVDLVEFSIDGGDTWLPAEGTQYWSAVVDVPPGATMVDLWVRATDIFGQSAQESVVLTVDQGAPSISWRLPPCLTGSFGLIEGTTVDALGAVTKIEIQVGGETAAWRLGRVNDPADGQQTWFAGWPLPALDGGEQAVRVRATDQSGNVGVEEGWTNVCVDTVPPQVLVQRSLGAVLIDHYGPDGTGDPALVGTATDGNGIAGVRLQLVDPMGNAQWFNLGAGPDWSFTPEFAEDAEGEHKARIWATDDAGNESAVEERTIYACSTDECLAEHATTVALGNTIWSDGNDNGLMDVGEAPLADVTVALFQEGADPATDDPVATVQTDADGRYYFDELTPGRYYVWAASDNFGAGGVLEGYVSSAGAGSDDGADQDVDENGLDEAVADGIASTVFDLAVGEEPEDDEDAGYDGPLLDSSVDATCDLGFYRVLEGSQERPGGDVHATWTFEYRIDVAHPDMPDRHGAGLMDVDSVVVIDQLPKQMQEYAVVVGQEGSYDPDTGMVTWDLGAMTPGETRQLTVSGRTSSGTVGETLTNTVLIHADPLIQPITLVDVTIIQPGGGPAPSVTPTSGPSPTLTPTAGPSPTLTPTAGPSPTPTTGPEATSTVDPTIGPDITATATMTATPHIAQARWMPLVYKQ